MYRKCVYAHVRRIPLSGDIFFFPFIITIIIIITLLVTFFYYYYDYYRQVGYKSYQRFPDNIAPP